MSQAVLNINKSFCRCNTVGACLGRPVFAQRFGHFESVKLYHFRSFPPSFRSNLTVNLGIGDCIHWICNLAGLI